MISYSIRLSMFALTAVFCLSLSVVAQDAGGTLRGTVTFEANGTIVDNASVVIVQLGRTTQTAEDGTYEFQNVPPGTYDVAARLTRFPDRTRRVEITGGGITTLDLPFMFQERAVSKVILGGGSQRGFAPHVRPRDLLTEEQLVARLRSESGRTSTASPGKLQ